jgi:hypothetical protein
MLQALGVTLNGLDNAQGLGCPRAIFGIMLSALMTHESITNVQTLHFVNLRAYNVQ